MPLDKPCLSPGCPKEGVYGRGSLLKGTMVWACPEHQHLLEQKRDVPAAPDSKPRDLFSSEPG